MDKFKQKVSQIIDNKHTDDLLFIKFKLMNPNIDKLKRNCVFVYKGGCLIAYSNSGEQLIVMCDNRLGSTILLELENINNYYEKNKPKHECQFISID